MDLASKFRGRAPACRGRGFEGDRIASKLVVDDPAHDLDIESLLLVRRDRALLGDVATSTLAIEDDGLVQEQEGGHGDALHQRPAEPAPREQSRKPSLKGRNKLGGIPGRIEPLEIGGAKQQLGGLGRGLVAACARWLTLGELAG